MQQVFLFSCKTMHGIGLRIHPCHRCRRSLAFSEKQNQNRLLMNTSDANLKVRLHALSFYLFTLLASCRSSRQQAPLQSPTISYPNTFGVYVLDGSIFTPIYHDIISRTPAYEKINRTFSGKLSILIFLKTPTSPNAYNWIKLYDWRFLGEKPMPDVPVRKMPIDSHSDMIMLVPTTPLNAGLYSVSIGNEPDYQFGVETPNEEEFWNTVLTKRSDCWQAHNHLGGLLFMRGDVNGAYSHFVKAVQLNPQNCESNNNLGLALSKLGKKEEAIHEFETAVKLQDDTAIETNLANTYLEVNQYDDAIKAYRHAIQLCPQNASAHCNLGWVLMQQGKVDDAIVEFRKTVELDPNMAQGKADLEQALRVKGNKP